MIGTPIILSKKQLAPRESNYDRRSTTLAVKFTTSYEDIRRPDGRLV